MWATAGRITPAYCWILIFEGTLIAMNTQLLESLVQIINALTPEEKELLKQKVNLKKTVRFRLSITRVNND